MRRSPLARALAGGPISLRVRAPHYLRRGHLRRTEAIRAYLSETEEPRLQLGEGFNSLPGWLNSDVRSGAIYLDITRRLPFADATFAFVFSEHVIEHIPRDAGQRLLGEIHRVLRPGGVVRSTTPDLQKILSLYEDRNPVISRTEYARFLDTVTEGAPHRRPAQLFNSFMREWGHQFIYDEGELTAAYEEAGLSGVVRHEPGESRHQLLRGLESHGPDWENAAEAMCMEATRP